MLCIIDYGSGNLSAITNICDKERIPYFSTSDPSGFDAATHFLLPGVGAFDPTIQTLRFSGVLTALEFQVLELKKPVLGICVGMHLLADGSAEGELPGLGWIQGRVAKIDERLLSRPPFLPHMGWNSIDSQRQDPLLQDIELDRGFYFLHSYYFHANNIEDVVATVEYGQDLPCVVRKDNIVGAQFHPEKSHSNGIRLLKNFVAAL